MKNLRIVIAGGSGFIGQAFAAAWAADNEVTVLSRRANPVKGGGSNTVRHLYWDGQTQGDWSAAVDGCDLLINLAGKSVNCRYTAANKAAILSSRLDSTRALAAAVSSAAQPPRLWIQASSATIYPHATGQPFTEDSTGREDDFSVHVCRAWESVFEAIERPGMRKAVLRTSIVLGQGGALARYAALAHLGLGGQQGSGAQKFSWIHIDDLRRVVEWLWQHPLQRGVFNATSPGPVTNAILMQQLRQVCAMPIGIPAPAGLLRLVAGIIGTAPELLLKSRWVLPARLLAAGFEFHYPALRPALENLLRTSPPRGGSLRRFKILDVRIQLSLFILSIALLPVVGLSLLIAGLGSWQLISTAVHLRRRRQFVAAAARQWYVRSLLAVAVLGAGSAAVLLWVENEVLIQAGVYFILSMLGIGPALAIWYFIVSCIELRDAARQKQIRLR